MSVQVKRATMLSDRAVSLLAVASAVAVANAYYIQPLTIDVGRALSIPGNLAGILPGLSQLGLACGLTLLLPLGDVLSARKLLCAIIPLQIVALILFAMSTSALTVALASLLIGVFGIAPYVLPPYASLHVPASRVGQVTGILTRGIIIGILLARTASGIIGTHFGWRAVYWIAAALMAVELAFLARVIQPPTSAGSSGRLPYRRLIGSLPGLLRTVPELRTAATCVALSFGSFMVFWVGVTLYLQSPAFGWTPQAIGLVAVVAAVAASAAPMFGRVVDHAGPQATRRAGLAGMVIAWVALAVCEGHLAGMAIGLIILDISATIVDISNRTILYGFDPAIRTRLNAVYQVAMFSGGAVTSVLVGACWSMSGWLAVCVLGVLPVAAALTRCWRLPH